MSLLFATQLTGVATAVLAVFAIVTGIYAIRAFRKQSQEVSAIEQQVKDQRELTRQQGEILRVQSDHLELQRQQLDEQHQAHEREAVVFGLQTKEISASLEQRERDADEQRKSQAAMVAAWFTSQQTPAGPVWGACIRNASDLPILDVRVSFHYIQEKWPGGDWAPVLRASPPEKIRVVPPESDRFYEIPEQVRNMIDQVNDSIYVVSIEFTDAAGNRWERDPRGALVART
jgi:hypothetical protein